MAKAFMLVLAGIAIGILIAPGKGTETRRKIAGRLEDYTDHAKDTIEDASNTGKSGESSPDRYAVNVAEDKFL
ncbi:MAG TPA: YtxH domain-containing protein [Flavisolibacter sp.]|jgi:gas vesicle protein|nr:YtxH domain-containing protein [Flavisolibacter sp.]